MATDPTIKAEATCVAGQPSTPFQAKLKLDPTTDPPPDLVIEVDYPSKSLNRFPIYARLGVPEIWRFTEGPLTIHLLDRTSYRESDASLAFPRLPVQGLSSLTQTYRLQGKRLMRRAFRQWERERVQSQEA